MSAAPGPGWYPAELLLPQRDLIWKQLPGEEFQEPFLEDTLRKHRRQAGLRTPLDALLAVAPGVEAPRAIFFHASRCGSTLVMQLLGCLPGCRSISEPPLLDALLSTPGVEDGHLAGLLRAYVRADHGDAPQLFLKTDSWHLPHLERLRRIFPGVPCFFLYREPAAILRSHRRAPGSQMVPGLVDPGCFRIDRATIDPADLGAYARRVLAAIFRQAVAAAEAGSVLPLSYSLLPGFVWEQLGPALGLPPDGWGRARERATRDAKEPHSLHQPSPAPPGPCGDPALDADHARLDELCRAWTSLKPGDAP